MKRGFTLPELLVVIGVLSIIGALTLTIFVRSLRANNKTQILLAIKQNGQIAMDLMDKSIRDADNIVCVENNSLTEITRSTLVLEKKGSFTRYRIISFTSVPDVANGYLIKDNPSPDGDNEIVPVPPPAGAVGYTTAFSDRVCAPNDVIRPDYKPAFLTDTNPNTGQSVKSGAFTLKEQSGFKDFIVIDFTLGSGESAPPAIAGEITPVNFHTSVDLR